MHALLFMIVALLLYILSYRFYATYLSEKFWKLDPNRETPAYTYQDDFEFVPTDKPVLMGHHFTSIAGCHSNILTSHDRLWYDFMAPFWGG